MEWWDARASPRYQDRLILIENSPNRTINAPRMLMVTLRSLTSRVGILNVGCRWSTKNEEVDGRKGYTTLGNARFFLFLHA